MLSLSSIVGVRTVDPKKNPISHPQTIISKYSESSTTDLSQVADVLFEKVEDLILGRFHLLKNNQFPEKSEFPRSSDICDYTAVCVPCA